jgi:XRE family transcriptional regulator of biofilm formation
MIGERLKRLREKKGLSVRQLSRLAHVPHETISRLENDVQRSPSLPVAMRLAKTLGVSLDYLAGMDELYGAEGEESQFEPAALVAVGT